MDSTTKVEFIVVLISLGPAVGVYEDVYFITLVTDTRAPHAIFFFLLSPHPDAATATASSSTGPSNSSSTPWAGKQASSITSLRAAPLPCPRTAAHRDAEAVLSWLRAQYKADPWLADSRVFVCGDSAGGNIVHHVAVRYGSGQLALDPVVRTAGCVLLWPFFVVEERTASEAAGLVDEHQFIGMALSDQAWRLALPVGATRDHPQARRRQRPPWPR
ncbi:carboxylesterase 15-like [Miscanthus floridulus]|uniref:carboxylesterase 15-like n=1 Tax=Miscanthus floridulus TaxID=154761 RepID=UPI003458A3CE